MSFSRPVSSELHSAGDKILTESALPNATTKYSGVFHHAGIMNRLEIVITAATSISITADKTLSLDLYHGDTDTGSFTKAALIASFTGAKTFAAGDEIARFVPCSKVKSCMKLAFTANEDLSAAKVSAELVHKG